MSSREQILTRVRNALSPLPQRAPLPAWDKELVRVRAVAGEKPVDAWAQFAERLRGVNGTPLANIAELAEYLRGQKCTRGYCDPSLLPLFVNAFGPEVTIETTFDRSRIDDYQFGITAAAGAIAETGTVILSDASTSRRLGALAPWIHVAVVRREQIHPDISAAIAAMPSDPNVIWITGPSKTADVEGILIEGVHGPGIQAVVLV